MMKKCIAFLIIVFLICSYSTLVVAARLGGKWDRNPKYNINDTNLPYEYKTATSNAVSSWNSVLSKINANIRFESSTITSMDLNISADYYGDIGWNAISNLGPDPYSGIYGYGSVHYNRSKMETFSPDKKKAIATHELGHILGLAHTTRDVIMNYRGSEYYYDVLKFTTPQPGDESDLDEIY